MECEWSAMVVPTYPEGGNHALKVCQLLAPPSGCARESAAVSGCQDSKNTLLATAPADSAETFTSIIAHSALSMIHREGGGPWPVRPRVRGGVFFGAESRAGDNDKPPSGWAAR